MSVALKQTSKKIAHSNKNASNDEGASQTYHNLCLKLSKLKSKEDEINRIDEENQKMLQNICEIHKRGGLVNSWNETYFKKSMNQNKRLLESLVIAEENQKILKKILLAHCSLSQKQKVKSSRNMKCEMPPNHLK